MKWKVIQKKQEIPKMGSWPIGTLSNFEMKCRNGVYIDDFNNAFDNVRYK